MHLCAGPTLVTVITIGSRGCHDKKYRNSFDYSVVRNIAVCTLFFFPQRLHKGAVRVPRSINNTNRMSFSVRDGLDPSFKVEFVESKNIFASIVRMSEKEMRPTIVVIVVFDNMHCPLGSRCIAVIVPLGLVPTRCFVLAAAQ